MTTIKTTKERAVEIYLESRHIFEARGSKVFRKHVIDKLVEECGCQPSSAGTFYSIAKRNYPIEGLGRGAGKPRPRYNNPLLYKASTPDNIYDPDEDPVFTVVELDEIRRVSGTWSFKIQGDASEHYDMKIEAWPGVKFVMISGLGPNPEWEFKLDIGEQVIKTNCEYIKSLLV